MAQWWFALRRLGEKKLGQRRVKRARALRALPTAGGGMVQKATDALFASRHRADASVSPSDWEVREFAQGVSLLPKL